MGEKNVDLQLIERVQQGDKRAFDLLVLKYQNRIMHAVSRYVYDQSEVQDVTQEAFIKAYRAIGNFRGDSAFYTWMYRIAINTAKNHLVAKGRRPPDVDVDMDDAVVLNGDTGLRESDTPEQLAMRDEVEQVIHDTIAELPDELRTAITLREIEGLSYEDIALTMDCPIGTVRSRIFRAREAIDNKVKPLLEGKV